MSEPLLDVRQVTLQYKTTDRVVTATHRVSFSVHAGDRFVLLGPSGCGKSSLLKAVGGYLAPTEGEITLRGRVLPIGGLKEKLLAAMRGGLKKVLIPEENVKDLTEIPDEIKNRLEIRPVRWVDQVLDAALERQPTPLPEAVAEGATGAEAVPPVAASDEPAEAAAVIKH